MRCCVAAGMDRAAGAPLSTRETAAVESPRCAATLFKLAGGETDVVAAEAAGAPAAVVLRRDGAGDSPSGRGAHASGARTSRASSESEGSWSFWVESGAGFLAFAGRFFVFFARVTGQVSHANWLHAKLFFKSCLTDVRVDEENAGLGNRLPRLFTGNLTALPMHGIPTRSVSRRFSYFPEPCRCIDISC